MSQSPEENTDLGRMCEKHEKCYSVTEPEENTDLGDVCVRNIEKCYSVTESEENTDLGDVCVRTLRNVIVSQSLKKTLI